MLNKYIVDKNFDNMFKENFYTFYVRKEDLEKKLIELECFFKFYKFFIRLKKIIFLI